MDFIIEKKSDKYRARAGLLKTENSSFKTPAYIMVATEGKIRTLPSNVLNQTRTQVVIANTFHLWQKIGDSGLNKFPGLHSYMNWDRPIITDSGGFQVFSMGFARELGGGKVGCGKDEEKRDENLVRVTNQGVYFSTQNGEKFLDAKKSIEIQEKLGADIILAFDEPSSPYHDKNYTKKAMERTHRWAHDSIKYHKRKKQSLFGIVQGGAYDDLRKESAKYIGSLDFDGFSIGGAFSQSFGSQRKETVSELEAAVPQLPDDKPRHLLGIGQVEDIFIGVKAGIDMFDCVIPTR
jgi:queuine tRNA-ribosyltransferase/7-cyano-7-deazaguanine tRNA-ribosyltransferase